MFTKKTVLLPFITALVFIMLISACTPNPQPAGLTPIPSLASAGNATLEPAMQATAAPNQPAGGATPTEEKGETEPAPSSEVARPSNPGGPGQAVSLTGDPAKGATIFTQNCASCHGPEGKQGVANPGSDDGTVPPLNPIDSTLVSKDYKTYATNVDLFIEHGSTPAGSAPTLKMPAWGDQKTLNPQQIADVISYIIQLNGGAK